MEEVGGKPVVGVQIAHIKGAEPSAARYDPTMTDEERAAFLNLILLCQAHHTTIDRISPEDYPVEILEAWKQENEQDGGLEALHGLTESSLEDLIVAAVAKAGRLREVKVEVSCAVQIGPNEWVATPFEIIGGNEALQARPKQLCVNISNVGSSDVSVDGLRILSEFEGVEGNPHYIPQVVSSELYPQFPFRLLNGDAKNWFVPFEAIQIMRDGLHKATGVRTISNIFVVASLATGEHPESLPILWTDIEPLLSKL
jgi:hypothetical protein